MRILACVDLSALSVAVVAEAGTLARATGASLTILHVAETEPVVSSDGTATAIGHRVPPKDLSERHASTKGLVDRLRLEGVEVEGGVELTDGAPEDLLLRTAESLEAQYIVIGSHGHGRVFELLLGSVTSSVIRRARMPVLVVPMHAAP